MTAQTSAELFPVGEHLGDELEARGWTQAEFAEILGRPSQFVSEIIAGRKEITRESASQIAAALGTSAEFWLKLQDSYLLWKQSQDQRTQRSLAEVKARARLAKLVPLSLLMKRGYVRSADIEGQTEEVLDLLGMTSFDDVPQIAFAARRSNVEENISAVQRAWVACVKKAALDQGSAEYDKEAFEELVQGLAHKARNPEAIAEFAELFARTGVKLVYVEAFPRGKLDGCAMLVDGNPVIGISGRGKRLDKVLFTILHEAAHVLLEHLGSDGEAIVDDLSDSSAGFEGDADRRAAELAIHAPLPLPPARPTLPWVQAHAEKLGVHPIVLIGRLQKEELLSWNTTLVRGAPSVTGQLERWASAESA